MIKKDDFYSTDTFFNGLVKDGFSLWTEAPEQIELSNPVLNGMLNGGISRRSVIQIAAQSGVGKSTLVLQICKELCEKGENVVYIDAEKGLTLNMMTTTGVIKYLNNNDINIGGRFSVIASCDCGEINTLIQKIAEAKVAGFIVIDSLGSLDSNIYDIGGTDANNPKVGADARSIKIVMKTINKISMKYDMTFICINHLAQEIGSYIPKENPTGGRAPQYLSDIIIKLTSKSSEFEKQNLGKRVEFEVIKSRFGKGKVKIPFYIRYGMGIAMIPTYREVLDKLTTKIDGKEVPVLEMRGAGNGSLYLEGQEFKFRGEAQLLKLIKEHYNSIKKLVTWRMFAVENKTDEIYDVMDEDVDLSYLPKNLSEIETVYATSLKAFFAKGVDATGQEYALYYDKDRESLCLSYNTNDFQEQLNPTKSDYNMMTKALKSYLESCN